MLTKDDASDLKSCIDRVKQTALELQVAQYRADDAQRALDHQLWRLQQQQPKADKPAGTVVVLETLAEAVAEEQRKRR